MLDRLISGLKVRNKIFVLVAFFAVPLCVLGFYSVSLISSEISKSKDEITGSAQVAQLFEQFRQYTALGKIAEIESEIHRIADASGLTLDPDLDSFYLQDVTTNRLPNLVAHLARANEQSSSQVERSNTKVAMTTELIPALFSALETVKRSDEKSYGISQSLSRVLTNLFSERDRLQRSLLLAVEDPKNNYDDALTQLVQISNELNQELQTLLQIRIAHFSTRLYSAMIAFIAAIIILPVLSYFIVRNITARLSALFAATTRAAENGDLSQNVSVSGNDEIFSLSQSFNSMIGSLRGVVTKIVHSSSVISTSIAEIAAVSKQQQATSSEIAATTTQIEATSKQICQTSEELARTVVNVQEVSTETAELATDGQQSLEVMQSTMANITEACHGISQKLEILNQRASKIGDIVTAIAKVADQTNLLSLNAAIEAERAGEYGQGFAVVAREIRRLADQTALSTLDIEQMVKEIQGAVTAGVMGMEKFSSEVKRGAQEVESASSQLSSIISKVQTLRPAFESVAEGMQSQALGARQITESLSQLSMAARQTADSLSQSNISIDQLHQATLLLDQEVERFELGQ